MLVIGDEILSGRTSESNMHFLAIELSKVGIDLKEVRIVKDYKPSIISAVRTLSASFDFVFSSGGIGPTHDDITSECMAEAFNCPVEINEDARNKLEDYYKRLGKNLNSARLRMARIPRSAELINNSVSAAPGFSIENVHVMAGVPKVFQAMVASILKTLKNFPAPITWFFQEGTFEDFWSRRYTTFLEKVSARFARRFPFVFYMKVHFSPVRFARRGELETAYDHSGNAPDAAAATHRRFRRRGAVDRD